MDSPVENFLARYAEALLARDADAVADLYAVPALIAVTEREQTRDFFAANWAGYNGVTEADPEASVIARAAHSVWVDVTWRYAGEPRERYVYQLLDGPSGWQIGVLTPLALWPSFAGASTW